MNPFGLIFVGIGVFALSGAAFDWDWFMDNRKALALSKLISRPGARIFYAVLGLALVVVGVLMFVGVIEDGDGG